MGNRRCRIQKNKTAFCGVVGSDYCGTWGALVIMLTLFCICPPPLSTAIIGFDPQQPWQLGKVKTFISTSTNTETETHKDEATFLTLYRTKTRVQVFLGSIAAPVTLPSHSTSLVTGGDELPVRWWHHSSGPLIWGSLDKACPKDTLRTGSRASEFS